MGAGRVLNQCFAVPSRNAISNGNFSLSFVIRSNDKYRSKSSNQSEILSETPSKCGGATVGEVCKQRSARVRSDIASGCCVDEDKVCCCTDDDETGKLIDCVVDEVFVVVAVVLVGWEVVVDTVGVVAWERVNG